MSASGQPYIVDLAVQNVAMTVQPEVNSPESQMRGSLNDPNSLGSVQKDVMKLAGQAMADRRYDTAVPTNEGFRDQGNLLLSLVAASLMVGLALTLRRRRR
jgi:LPXTG-motif cell wall-anchored protein